MQAAPESVPRRRLSAPERREAVLDAGLRLFAENGYELASMEQIAAGAGVTKPVLYDHFASKRDLYVALVEREGDSLSAELTETFDLEAALDERLRALAAAAIGWARRNRESGRLLFRAPTGDAAVRRAHARVRRAARTAMAGAILSDPAFEASPGLSRRASAELLGDLHNAVLERLVHWALDNPATSSKALTEVFVDVIWRGLDR